MNTSAGVQGRGLVLACRVSGRACYPWPPWLLVSALAAALAVAVAACCPLLLLPP